MNRYYVMLSFAGVLAAAPCNAGSPTFTILKVADQSTNVPGSTNTFTRFQYALVGYLPALSGGAIAFFGVSAGGRGIYRSINGALVMIADSTTVIPGTTRRFGGGGFFHDPSIDREGRVSFAGRAGTADGGIYIGSGGPLTVVADDGTPIPSGSGTFHVNHLPMFSGDVPEIDGGNVVFRGGNLSLSEQGVYLYSNGTLQVIADLHALAPASSGVFTRFDLPQSGTEPDSRGSHVAFTGCDATPTCGIYRWSGGALSRVVAQGDPVPERAGSVFNLFIGPTPANGGDVAFYGHPFGIYAHEGSSTTLTRVADTATTIPGKDQPPFTFHNFGSSPSYDGTDSEDLAFQGLWGTGNNGLDGGVYARLGHSLVKVIASGDTLDGKTVRITGIGKRAISKTGDTRAAQIVFYVSFTDSSEGIYLATQNPECSDGEDNDGDGQIDYPADPGCAAPESLLENPECSDTIDNDGDGFTDYPADPGCTSPASIRENPQCSDGRDNDEDGLTDFPADPGCRGPDSDTETTVCDDHIDNDGDGLTDFPADPDCRSGAEPSEERCNRRWRIRWFGCDIGHDNSVQLERDGTPVCGSGNCPGGPGSCWGPVYTDRTFANGDISWSVGVDGALTLTHGTDVQVYGDTYLFVRTARTLDVPVIQTVGRVWLNDVEVFIAAPSTTVPLGLAAGWNHVEWTSYHQHSSTEFSLSFPFATSVDGMHTAPDPACEAISGPAPTETVTPIPTRTATPMPTITPSMTPVSTPTPPPAAARDVLRCEIGLGTHARKFAATVHAELGKCLQLLLKERAAGHPLTKAIDACARLNLTEPTSFLAKSRVAVEGAISDQCTGVMPSDIGSPCAPTAIDTAQTIACVLDQHLLAAQEMVKAEYAETCSLLSIAGLDGVFSAVCAEP